MPLKLTFAAVVDAVDESATHDDDRYSARLDADSVPTPIVCASSYKNGCWAQGYLSARKR